MKLRNKETGGIVRVEFLNNWQTDDGTEIGFRECNTNIVYSYNSLTELNADWEDAPEEPKTFFTLYYDGTISEFKDGDDEQIRDMKAIGNHFETREEAEKAVEKLKAWKRLKDDYHIRFNLDFVKNTISFTYRIDDTLHSVMDDEPIVFEDMKTIFGDEE